jgi:two-component system, OmpR family, sensor histidine kinase KdpD
VDGPAQPRLLRHARPPLSLGIAVVVVGVAATTLVLYPLGDAAPRSSLGVLYLLVVLVASTWWGLRLGVAAALLSAAAFNWFHIPPTGHFTIAESENWVALVTFVVVAVVTSGISELARQRAAEADARRREADLAAEMARLLLGGEDLRDGMALTAQRIASALDCTSASIERGAADGGDRRIALALRDSDGTAVGTLLLPGDLPAAVSERARARIVPALEALLAAAIHREELRDEVVETAALRKSDVVKTAVLRAVSHDLRSPLTAIVTAGEALGSPLLDPEDRRELSDGVVAEGQRLAGLIDKLLDLSRLEAGSALPRPDWCAVDEVLHAAGDGLRPAAGSVTYAIAADLPLVRADSAQLERVFGNLIENAVRHSGGQPVSVRARAVGSRLVVRIVDRGPGIPENLHDRIFTPFYQASARPSAGGPPAANPGAGLGLAIARGFVEANGGRLRVESLPGQGSTFVVELPIPDEEPEDPS